MPTPNLFLNKKRSSPSKNCRFFSGFSTSRDISKDSSQPLFLTHGSETETGLTLEVKSFETLMIFISLCLVFLTLKIFLYILYQKFGKIFQTKTSKLSEINSNLILSLNPFCYLNLMKIIFVIALFAPSAR